MIKDQGWLEEELGADVTVNWIQSASSNKANEALRAGAVDVVHAAGEGDDRIVAEVATATNDGKTVTVVTADRGLRGRAVALSASVAGPDALLSRLAEDSSASDRSGASDRLD